MPSSNFSHFALRVIHLMIFRLTLIPNKPEILYKFNGSIRINLPSFHCLLSSLQNVLNCTQISLCRFLEPAEVIRNEMPMW